MHILYHFFWETSDGQKMLNGDWGRPGTLERQLTSGKRLEWELRVSYLKCGFREGTPKTDSNQVQKYLHKHTQTNNERHLYYISQALKKRNNRIFENE